MTNAKVLRMDSIERIRQTLDGADSPKDFLDEVATIANDPDSLLELPFDTSELTDLVVGSDRALAEVTNAIALYEGLGALPPVAAADERLWTYLALVPFRGYMERRWPIDESRSWKNRAQDRWLMKSATYGVLIRHGISRLWWLADLTFDPALERPLSVETGDPWIYLRTALASEDRIMAIFDRDSGLVPELRFVLLEHCYRSGPRATEVWLRSLMKEITLTSGYRDLSSLDSQELAEMLNELDPGSMAVAQTT